MLGGWGDTWLVLTGWIADDVESDFGKLGAGSTDAGEGIDESGDTVATIFEVSELSSKVCDTFKDSTPSGMRPLSLS